MTSSIFIKCGSLFTVFKAFLNQGSEVRARCLLVSLCLRSNATHNIIILFKGQRPSFPSHAFFSVSVLLSSWASWLGQMMSTAVLRSLSQISPYKNKASNFFFMFFFPLCLLLQLKNLVPFSIYLFKSLNVSWILCQIKRNKKKKIKV